ncbi:MAG: hypothetical protein GY756_08575 [bacterium]|nr:hypothetical protein [bacterium]
MTDNYSLNKLKLSFQQAICVATAFTIGIIIDFSLNQPHGYWIPMTISLMFLLPKRGSIIRRTRSRVMGTFLGLLFGFLYTETLMYSDYRWIYLLPVIWFFMWYFYSMTNNYTIFVMLLSMFIPIIFDLFASSKGYYMLNDTLALRFIFTIVGVAVALLCEFTIYKKAALSLRDFKFEIREYFKDSGDIISFCNEYFLSQLPIDKKFIDITRKQMSKVISLESLYLDMAYEYYDKNKIEKNSIKKLFTTIEEINYRLRKIICIIGHERFGENKYEKENLTETINAVANKYRHVGYFFYGRKDDVTEKIYELIRKQNNGLSSTSLYCKEIYALSKVFDDYSKFIYNVFYCKDEDEKLNEVNINS